MSLYVLALIALLPFALVGFLYREAHVDMRQALLSVAAVVAVLLALVVLVIDGA